MSWRIADMELESRLILGTGGFRTHEALAAALSESGAEIATVALRRARPGNVPRAKRLVISERIEVVS